MKPQVKIKEDFHLLESKTFQWMQLINTSGTSWKKSEFDYSKYLRSPTNKRQSNVFC